MTAIILLESPALIVAGWIWEIYDFFYRLRRR